MRVRTLRGGVVVVDSAVERTPLLSGWSRLLGDAACRDVMGVRGGIGLVG